jgi:hypothetical protein
MMKRIGDEGMKRRGDKNSLKPSLNLVNQSKKSIFNKFESNIHIILSI